MPNGKILATAAWIWTAPVGEANPDPDSIGFNAPWGGNWSFLGNTLEPLAMTIDETVERVTEQQSNAPVCVLTVEQTITLKTVLSQHEAVNYQLVFGGTLTPTAAASGAVGREDLVFGGEATRPEYKIGFEVLYKDENNVSLPWRYFFHKGSFSLDGDIEYDRTEANGIPIAVTILNDTTLSVGSQSGIIQQVTAPALP